MAYDILFDFATFSSILLPSRHTRLCVNAYLIVESFLHFSLYIQHAWADLSRECPLNVLVAFGHSCDGCGHVC